MTAENRREYYSLRNRKREGKIVLDLGNFRKLFYNIYLHFEGKDYFQQALGKYCPDTDYEPGTMGASIEAYSFMVLKKEGLFPLNKDRIYNDTWLEDDHKAFYSEEDLFDLIEFLFDHVSKPVDGYYHSWDNCGWHYETFDKGTGQEEFRKVINENLKLYGDGWELSSEGEILALGDNGLQNLYEANIPITEESHEKSVKQRVESAIKKFRRYKSSVEDRKDAVRDLADVLEFLRPQLKEVLLTKDENDLFNIANNFGIRHHNDKQKTDYDLAVWLSWMFYHYLTTIYTALHLIDRGFKAPK